jgi:hypothetical protein
VWQGRRSKLACCSTCAPPSPPHLPALSALPAAEEAKEAEEEAAPAAAEYDASFAAAQLPGAEEGYDAYG